MSAVLSKRRGWREMGGCVGGGETERREERREEGGEGEGEREREREREREKHHRSASLAQLCFSQPFSREGQAEVSKINNPVMPIILYEWTQLVHNSYRNKCTQSKNSL
jgi:hypothetical protein